MNQKHLLVVLLVALTLGLSVFGVDAQGPTGAPKKAVALAGTSFTYQGQLKKSGATLTSTCTFNAGLWDSLSNSTGQQGITQTLGPVGIASGLFTIQPDFGNNVFNGDARYLALSVQCTGDGSATALSPRQALTPAPMAFALPGLYTQQTAGTPNVIGGYSGNTVTIGAVGATIAGGGNSVNPNIVTDDYGVVGGGKGNTAGNGTGLTTDAANATVGGGYSNNATNQYATVGGGLSNYASGDTATVGGGYNNNASNQFTFIGGGRANHADGDKATISGGETNTASGRYSTIPGGFNNTASMTSTFAAGRNAKANHNGAFVWGDSNNNSPSGTDFASTGTDQFLIRAGGGVGIGDSTATSLNPPSQLYVRSGGNLTKPQLELNQYNNDYARMRLLTSYSGNANYWDIAGYSASGDALSFFFSGTSSNVVTFSDSNAHTIDTKTGAYLTSTGVWTNNSDRNLKTNFQNVDGRDILARVSALPMTSWNYKIEDPSVRHIGPMAQDFYAAFNVGEDNKHITPIDEGGVALAAIQGLNQVVQEEDARIATLEKQNAVLEQKNADLDARVIALEQVMKENSIAAHADNNALPTQWLLFGGLIVVGLVAARRQS